MYNNIKDIETALLLEEKKTLVRFIWNCWYSSTFDLLLTVISYGLNCSKNGAFLFR